MLRKFVISSCLATLFAVAGCHHSKVQNPIANVDSKQPDKVLFDRAMVSMKKARYTEARTLLDTLLTTYPDSEFVARAMLSKGDAWFAEGGTAGLAQSEVEYKNFITFFPDMPEAAEAQLKVANIHYKEMEKPDRDYNQAMRAADEYKELLNRFPDSKLAPLARQRLREVQEVLAERQWRIARFYFLRNNLAASQARLSSLLDSYPLFSAADEALFMLGNIYEKESAAMRLQKNLPEGKRVQLAHEYEQKAIESYSKVITRYPVMARTDDARKRLQAMKVPVPAATPEAIAQNQAEEDSRMEMTRLQEIIGNFRRHPDVARSAEVGEPTMAEEHIDSAPALIQHLNAEIQPTSATVGTGTPGANQAPPSSAAQPAPAGAGSQPAPANSQPNTQTTSPGTPAPPARINEIGTTSDPSAQNANQTAQNGQQQSGDNQDSSSQKKKKKGLRKLIPF